MNPFRALNRWLTERIVRLLVKERGVYHQRFPNDMERLRESLRPGAPVLLLGLLAVPLARTTPRQGKYAKLVLGILCYFVYNNAVGILQELVSIGELSPYIGVWPAHLAMAALVASLVYAQTHRHRRRGRRPPASG